MLKPMSAAEKRGAIRPVDDLGGGELRLGVPIIAAYTLVVSSPVIAALLAGGGVGPFSLELGKLFGLAGSAIILMQVVLAARIRPFCRHYGLDIVMRFHRLMAVAGIAMLVMHPVLIAWGRGYWKLLYSPDAAWMIWVGGPIMREL